MSCPGIGINISIGINFYIGISLSLGTNIGPDDPDGNGDGAERSRSGAGPVWAVFRRGKFEPFGGGGRADTAMFRNSNNFDWNYDEGHD